MQKAHPIIMPWVDSSMLWLKQLADSDPQKSHEDIDWQWRATAIYPANHQPFDFLDIESD